MNPAEELKKVATELEKMSKKAGLESNPEDFSSYADFIDYLQELGVSKIVSIMNDYPAPSWWFPSAWDQTGWNKPYPRILAEALVASDSNESITDLANIYYARRNISPGAVEVFKKDILQNSSKFAALLGEFGVNGWGGLVQNHLDVVKALLRSMADDQIKEHISWASDYFGDDLPQYLNSVGIDSADYQ